MTGRPSKRTDAIVDAIIDRLSHGEPLAQICRDEGMPHQSTFRDWANADEDLSRRFARAREDGFDQIALDAVNIADYGDEDQVPDADGNLRTNSEVIQRSKLRVETRLKLLAKWDPKRYGDRQVIAGDPEQPLAVNHSGSVALDPGEAYLRMLNDGRSTG